MYELKVLELREITYEFNYCNQLTIHMTTFGITSIYIISIKRKQISDAKSLATMFMCQQIGLKQ